MSGRELGLQERAAELRQAFDRSFAEQAASAKLAEVELLSIRVRGERYAVRLDQVLALHADRKLVPVPSPRHDLLGLLGVRGQVTPIYDLGQLLGHAALTGSPRWTLLVRASTPFGVAFEQFEAHLRVAPSALVSESPEAAAAGHQVESSVVTPEGPRPLIDLTALVAAVTASSRQSSAAREGQT